MEYRTVCNRILCNLDDDAFEALRPYLMPIELKRAATIQNANARLEHVYFIESGCVSRVARTQNDGLVEVAIVGNSGFVGIGFALGTMTSVHRTMVLMPGWALRIEVKELQKVIEGRPAIREVLLRYVQSLIVQKSQMSLCNARHELDQRLARWMLLANERLEDDSVPVTQDLLAMMLGVRQPSISFALASFEAEGLISRSRGTILIVNRDALKRRACECFGIIQQVYNRLLPVTVSGRVIESYGHTL